MDRKIKTRTVYELIGSDYSAQEPRMLASYSADEKMKQAYLDGKDLYAVVASMAFHNNYEDNLEFRDGVLQPDGKKRRSAAKSILLGLMYGRGANAIAEQIGGTVEEAQGIIDSFYNSFPAVKKWMDETYEFVHKYGYVEDFWGRRRRLPDINLPQYEIVETEELKNRNKTSIDFNPLLETIGAYTKTKNPLVEKYKKLIYECKGNKQKVEVKSNALKDGITIIDNGGFIAQAERQCVNARIQGGSASLTKLAMIKIANDEKMKEYDAKLIIGVHDELLMECKKEYAEEAAQQLSYDMITAASDNGIPVPMKCDADVFTWWYQDQIIGDIIKKSNKLVEEKQMDKKEAIDKVFSSEFSCLTDEQYTCFHDEVMKEMGV